MGAAARPRATPSPRLIWIGQQLVCWLLVLTVVGYPVAGSLAAIFDLGNRQASIPFRLLIDVLSVAAVGVALLLRLRIRPDPWVTLFLGLYLLRMVADVQRTDVPTARDDLLFYVAATLPPVLGVAALARLWRDSPAAWAMFLLGAGTCTLALVTELTGLAGDRSHTEAMGRLGFDTVDPITFGQIGVSTLLAALAAWSTARNWARRGILLAGCGPPVAVIILANSRSPFLAIAVALTVFLLLRGHWRIFLGLAAAGVIAVTGGHLLDRLSGSRLVTLSDGSVIDRLVAQRDAFAEFKDHPILGSAHLELVSQFYPHNLFFESAMAMGVGGLALFTLISALALWRTLLAMRSSLVLVALLLWQFFVLGQVSSSLYTGGGPMFCLMFLLAANKLPSRRRPGSGRKSPGPPVRYSAAGRPDRIPA